MSERKYTDEEIMKACECCFIKGACTECPIRYEELDESCIRSLGKAAWAMFNHQKAYDEKLQEVNADLNESLRLAAEANKDLQVELDAMRGAANSYKMHYEKAVREIFDKIGKILYKHTKIAIKKKNIVSEITIDYIGEDIAELKEEYTKGADNNAR